MKIGIFTKPENDNDALRLFCDLLDERKTEYFYIETEKSAVPDVIAVFGGDGTILASSSYAIKHDVPLIAINTGTVGFLSSFEKSEVERAVEILHSDKYNVSTRSLLKIRGIKGEYTALNDAVVERDKAIRGKTVVSRLNLSLAGKSVYNLSSDGIIIATPTGSTAYSLSAGGVVLTPNLNSFIATPICAHSLRSRPIVYPDDNKAVITILENSCGSVLSVDGKPVESIKAGQSVVVEKSSYTLKLIEKEDNFFDRLFKKLG